MIDSKLILKTTSPTNPLKSIATFELTYPLFIHAELMTHRVFSRNCASARAIPVNRMVELVEKNSTAPKFFRRNQSGMAAGDRLSTYDNAMAHDIWDNAMRNAVDSALAISDASGPNVHKQWANRLLMPFTHMRTILTATDWDNWNDLRAGDIGESGAQDEISILANMMQEQYDNAPLHENIIHIPYSIELDPDFDFVELVVTLIQSIAKISRISYMREDRETNFEKDCEQVLRLVSGKFHASPFEHIAFEASMFEADRFGSGNLDKHFAQLRHCNAIMNAITDVAAMELSS